MARLFAGTADARPDSAALIDERGTTTWRRSTSARNRLIHAFRAAGLQAGDTVALLGSNRREYFEVMAAGMHTPASSSCRSTGTGWRASWPT